MEHRLGDFLALFVLFFFPLVEDVCTKKKKRTRKEKRAYICEPEKRGKKTKVNESFPTTTRREIRILYVSLLSTRKSQVQRVTNNIPLLLPFISDKVYLWCKER